MIFHKINYSIHKFTKGQLDTTINITKSKILNLSFSRECVYQLFIKIQERPKTDQLTSFLSLFSAPFATLFCGSNTSACLKSGNIK